MKLYPMFLYHESGISQKFPDAAAHAAAGAGWHESPVAAAEAVAKKVQAAAPADPPASSGGAAGDLEAAAAAAREQAEAAALYEADAAVIVEKLANAPKDVLERVRRFEKKNPAGPRKPILDAVTKAMKALKDAAK